MEHLKKTKKANYLALLLTFIILAASFVPTQKAHAASIQFDKKVFLTLYKNKKDIDTSAYCVIRNVPSGKTISKVKSSKKKVIAAKQETGLNMIKLIPKKPGTAKITFQYAKKKYTITATAAYWKNPCKSFKIGDTDYSRNFKVSGRYCVNRKSGDLSAKVSIVPNKGWKLVEITNDGSKVKNNSNVLLRPSYVYGGGVASGSHVRATFKNKKTKQVVYLVLEYSDQDKPNENQFWVMR